MPRTSPSAIADDLRASEPRLGRVIELVGLPPARRAIPVAQRFERLSVAILHQQLAGAAAATITRRVIDVLGGSISPEGIVGASTVTLRSCGVSEAKDRALRDLAMRVLDGRLVLSSLGRRSDHAVVAELSAVRGIGRWTAEMFLMGPLGRHDIWPVGDLGVRNGWAIIAELDAVPDAASLEEVADHVRPWRSTLAWYCWQAVDVARSNGGLLPR